MHIDFVAAQKFLTEAELEYKRTVSQWAEQHMTIISMFKELGVETYEEAINKIRGLKCGQ
jgi:hypothetical protein